MNIASDIIGFACEQKQFFRKKDVLEYLNSGAGKVSEGTVRTTLTRLVESGKLQKTGYGLFAYGKEVKAVYRYCPSEEEKVLAGKVKQKFPFTNFCIWRSSALTPFMQHVPAVNTTFIDVERVAMESVFSYLQGLELGCQILLNPSQVECDRYLTNENIVVVRLLTSEAPTEVSEGVVVPTLEKILVDATEDKELDFAQGAEIYHIFENAFERNDVNQSRLMRYAKRRNRNKLIEEILKSLELRD